MCEGPEVGQGNVRSGNLSSVPRIGAEAGREAGPGVQGLMSWAEGATQGLGSEWRGQSR